jgi:1-acyl-sn-glycerol-3-phosphate acyltransferase
MTTAHNANLLDDRLLRNLKLLWLLTVGFGTLVVGSLLTLMLGILTVFQFPELYRQTIVRYFSKIILKVAGISVIAEGDFNQQQPCVYISNHLSGLDIFIICSLGLRNTRYFMSVSTLKFLPMTIVGLITKVFYIAEQTDPEKRTLCFKKAERELLVSNENVYLTPEGVRNNGRNIQRFNRGAFHLAIALQRPIVALFIDCPVECHPGFGIVASSGRIRVRCIEVVQTTELSINDVDALRDSVRNVYLRQSMV